ncbi:Uncharacterised protein [Vibrio cholerae]|nr:Uncharacterised protein [Vibrio cholerae]
MLIRAKDAIHSSSQLDVVGHVYCAGEHEHALILAFPVSSAAQ